MYSLQFETIYPIAELKRRKGVAITAVDPEGLGEALGLAPGDRVLAINDRKVRDYLDFQFYTGSEDFVELTVLKHSGQTVRCEIGIEDGDIWGLDFEQFAPRQCGNECLFCFCEQNPADARKSLFFRDEDIRLSFLHGNYTTMTTLTEEEFARIVEQRLSPQFVSVHATDPEVRRHLLGRNKADDILGTMRRLLEHDIELHAQVVLCPRINDGDVLKQTVYELAELHPGLVSTAIVPLGLTKHHRKRHLLTPVWDEWFGEIIELVTPWQKDLKKRIGTPFAFLGDEFYIRAGQPIPTAAHYGPYPQIEDGVGMVRRFLNSFRQTVKQQTKRLDLIRQQPKSVVTVATGTLFFPTLRDVSAELNQTFGTRIHAVPVTNNYFGPEVNVAGLLAGSDYLAARESYHGDILLIPSESVMGDQQLLIDGMTLPQLQQQLGKQVLPSGVTGKDFVRTILGLE
ncbi:MAG: DUF512 domain-containing protein [Blastocatellia bacterium]|nr:DUF512 domain-containing protein [Blastocatellia bacterium]